MGTTLTALYVGEHEVAIAHVGDSRAYCLRDGKLLRLTDDHTLVDELMRQGRLTPEEAVEHPQRSVITRALGPEGAVDVDTRSFQARGGRRLPALQRRPHHDDLRGGHRRRAEHPLATARRGRGADQGRQRRRRPRQRDRRAAAPQGGGGVGPRRRRRRRDDDRHARRSPATSDTASHEVWPADRRRTTSARPGPATWVEPAGSALRRRGGGHRGIGHGARAAGARAQAPAPPAAGPRPSAAAGGCPTSARLVVTVVVLGLIAAGGYLALESVYFIGTNSRGLVTLYQGIPYQLPGHIDLYSRKYVSGVSASTIPAARRKTLLNHHLHSEATPRP